MRCRRLALSGHLRHRNILSAIGQERTKVGTGGIVRGRARRGNAAGPGVAARRSRIGASLAIGNIIGARGQAVEFGLDLLPRRFQRRIIGLARYINRFARRHPDPAKGKIDGAVIPIIEFNTSAASNRDRIDRSAGTLCQLNNAETANARDLRNVGGNRNIVALRERIEHLVKGGRAVLEFAAMRAGAADRLDA
jgi:hypothetical protein